MADGGNGVPEPTQVSDLGLYGTVVLYSTAGGMCVCGPVMLGFTVFADAPLLLGGILSTLLCTPLGIGLWAHTSLERDNNRRLDTVGVTATAEVTDLTDWEDGDDAGVTVALRISGPGFRTFETTWKRSRHPALRVGLRLTAVVDPADNLFRVHL
ncbi:hypothetical protein G9272_25310 [Streptomyces asoensis]|uniref:Uncharacterized protein n=1 Tax=Streptomyces asoensis TaxID=249586 RepID=A0A6M4WSP5_9ACTN|nr:hypothetical protein [Streptomyces asoensis]QJT03189.1 hypothetical protein G9272_25310 [Streptomyces asoensis]